MLVNGTQLKRSSGLIFTVIFAVGIYTFLILKYQQSEEEGTVTLLRYDRFKGEADGSSHYFTIFIHGDSVKGRLPVTPDFRLKEGTLLFAKVKPDSPTDYPVLYPEMAVPSCILNKSIRYMGWKAIPDCQ